MIRQIFDAHGQSDSDSRRHKIDSLRSKCTGGTSMESALAQIHSSPELGQFENPIVFVISDGKPQDESATIAQINKFEAEDIPLIGVGIGSDSREMASLFKHAVVDVNVAAVASSLCNAVHQALCSHITRATSLSHLRAA